MSRLRLRDPLPLVLGMAATAAVLAYAVPGMGAAAQAPPSAASVAAEARRLTRPLVTLHHAIAHRSVAPHARRTPVRAVRARVAPAAHRIARASLAAIAVRFGVSAVILRRVVAWAPLAQAAWPGHAPLVLAVMSVESGGLPNLYTPAPDGLFSAGLMQVASEWWSTYGMTWDTATAPQANVDAGAAILRQDVRQYGEWDGLQAFNAGPGGVGNDQGYAASVWSWLAPMRAAVGNA